MSPTTTTVEESGKWTVCVDFTDLNKACPKDSFPLPKIDQMVDATAGHEQMSFLDAFRGYHQIPLAEEDQEKTVFITPEGTYCYRVMPFGLKNAGATYQRLVTRMFSNMIDRTVEVYIDDMVVKSKKGSTHCADLRETFEVLRKYKMKLNASKCAFGVGSGKFLGFLVTHRGIEVNPEQVKAITELQTPRTVKEVQRLTRMAAALGRFISRASDKCRPFFQSIKGKKGALWTQECEDAFAKLKEYLASLPILSTASPEETLYLYLAVSEQAVSSTLMRKDDERMKPVYYVSKVLLDAETRYTSLEKLALALVCSARKLRHYFQVHQVIVITDQPLKSLFHKADLSGRIAKWAVELGEFDIRFEPRKAIKGQVVADFIAEFQPDRSDESVVASQPMELDGGWTLSVDGSSNQKGAGVGIILVSPDGCTLEKAIRLGFEASNNEAEYEALIAGVRLAAKLGAMRLQIFSDSQLVVNQIIGEYMAKDERMIAYQAVAEEELRKIPEYSIQQVGRAKNTHADALASLASAVEQETERTITVEFLAEPSIHSTSTDQILCNTPSPSWMDQIVCYLKNGDLPEDKKEAHKLRLKAARFWLSPKDELYRRSFGGPYLKCVHPV